MSILQSFKKIDFIGKILCGFVIIISILGLIEVLNSERTKERMEANETPLEERLDLPTR